MSPTHIKTFVATIFALLAFAGNSVLCRLALGSGEVDATSFTIVRLVSGALAFVAILGIAKRIYPNNKSYKGEPELHFPLQKWLSAFMLFTYAAGFSFAYIVLDTGVGALVLFGTVQLTMIAASLFKQEKLPWFHLLGILIAFSGLFYLIYSQLDESSKNLSFTGFLFMFMAGVAWGAYSLFGRASKSPFIDTGANFMRSVIFCIPLLVAYLYIPFELSVTGLWLALASGVITSAFGYAIWYIALPNLSRVQAGVVQLLVPIIAAIGGLIWVGEPIGATLMVAQVMVLGGIGLVLIRGKTVIIRRE